MALVQLKSIATLPNLVSPPNVLGNERTPREQIILNTFRDLYTGQNEGYAEGLNVMSGNGLNMRFGTGTIPLGTSNEYSFNPGFNLPPTSSRINVFGEDFYNFEYHVQVGLLENALGFNFGGHGRYWALVTPSAIPEFQIKLDFNLGTPTIADWDFCWLVMF